MTGPCVVVNARHRPDPAAVNVYCGRGSALGNPYKMGAEAERDEVCALYEDWFYAHINAGAYVAGIQGRPPRGNRATCQLIAVGRAALTGSVNLKCYCAPKRCHCETIANFVNATLFAAAINKEKRA